MLTVKLSGLGDLQVKAGIACRTSKTNTAACRQKQMHLLRSGPSSTTTCAHVHAPAVAAVGLSSRQRVRISTGRASFCDSHGTASHCPSFSIARRIQRSFDTPAATVIVRGLVQITQTRSPNKAYKVLRTITGKGRNRTPFPRVVCEYSTICFYCGRCHVPDHDALQIIVVLISIRITVD